MTAGYTPPPTFYAGQILSATQLNILSDDIEYLYGLANVPVIPTHVKPQTYQAMSETYYVRHRLRYLRVTYMWDRYTDPGPDFDFEITYNGTSVYTDSISSAWPGTGTITTNIDLNDVSVISPTPTVGTWYPVVVTCTTNSFVGTYCRVLYAVEGDTDHLIISVTDGVVVDEVWGVDAKPIGESDDITLGESVTVYADRWDISETDGVVVGETVTMSAPKLSSETDGITLAEDVTVTVT